MYSSNQPIQHLSTLNGRRVRPCSSGLAFVSPIAMPPKRVVPLARGSRSGEAPSPHAWQVAQPFAHQRSQAQNETCFIEQCTTNQYKVPYHGCSGQGTLQTVKSVDSSKLLSHPLPLSGSIVILSPSKIENSHKFSTTYM